MLSGIIWNVPVLGGYWSTFAIGEKINDAFEPFDILTLQVDRYNCDVYTRNVYDGEHGVTEFKHAGVVMGNVGSAVTVTLSPSRTENGAVISIPF